MAAFVQQVNTGSTTVETFDLSTSSTSDASSLSSLDVSQFVGLAELWERRDRAFACATIPPFTLEEKDKSAADELLIDKTCVPFDRFETPNHLINETAETP